MKCLRMLLESLLPFVLLQQAILASAPSEVLLLISSQDATPQRQQSVALRNDLLQQRQQLAATIPRDYVINVHIMHEIFNYPGDWTLLAALPHLIGGTRLLNDNTKWIILCQDNTYVSLQRLLDRLALENTEELSYYGYALHDQEATIIHHFDFFKNPTSFPYPMLSAGIVFTGHLLRSLAKLVADNRIARRSEFSIDAAHELARFIFDHLTPTPTPATSSPDAKVPHKVPNNGEGSPSQSNSDEYNRTLLQRKTRKIILKSAAYICPKAPMSLSASASASASASPSSSASVSASTMSSSPSSSRALHTHKVNEDCLMYALPEAQGFADATATTTPALTCRSTGSEHIYFAIKTCEKFHKERVPIIESTWASYAVHRRYYSDVTDSSIPTVNTGIPNVATGHCAKTLAILQLSLKDIEEQMKRKRAAQIRWIALVDDDTMLSVARLASLLACQDPYADLYLGERYGYRLHATDGFNYITGGGGIVFSLSLVRRILQACSCPAANAPDDMILGYCLQSLGVRAVHTNRFHQARPQDYANELLRLMPPISFHKFWQLDPIALYEIWFHAADRQMSRRLPDNWFYGAEKHFGNVTLSRNALKGFDKMGNWIGPRWSSDFSAYAALQEIQNKHLDL